VEAHIAFEGSTADLADAPARPAPGDKVRARAAETDAELAGDAGTLDLDQEATALTERERTRRRLRVLQGAGNASRFSVDGGAIALPRPRLNVVTAPVERAVRWPIDAGRALPPAGTILQRAFDIAVALTLLVLMLPLLLIVAAAIRLDSRGPSLFRQQRMGRDRQAFTMLKFRTMTVGADAEVDPDHVRERIVTCVPEAVDERGRPLFKAVCDPRVTRVGRLLRRFSIDELPQLWNVLRGEMTLVGFRPPIPYEVEHYPEWYNGRFAMKPGLTGLWQVSGRNEKSYEDMVRLDLEYLEQRSWKLDAKLLAKTALVVFHGRGAC